MRKSISSKIRQEIFDLTNGHCAYCGCELTLKSMQIDHIYAFNSGGKCDKRNYFPACRPCNFRKSTLNIEDFRKQLEDTLKNLNQYSANYRQAKRFGMIYEFSEKVVFFFELNQETASRLKRLKKLKKVKCSNPKCKNKYILPNMETPPMYCNLICRKQKESKKLTTQ
jgi:hypothetical protein